MKQYMQTHIQIALILFILALGATTGAVVADHNQKEIETTIKAQLENQRTYMFTLAEITDRNGADEVVLEIIADCQTREEYESLLIRLGSLTKKELILLQSFFDGCGDYHATVKALMVAKLERELQSYTGSLALLNTLSSRDADEYQKEIWTDIVSHEKLRSALLTDLSNIQKEIISELISGSSVQSTKVSSLVGEAQDIGQLLIVYDRKIDEGREALKH